MKQVAISQSIKVYVLRIYYRLANWWAWRGQFDDTPYSERQIPSTAGTVGARIYPGSTAADKPLIVYFHGGGWVIGDLKTHHPFCQALGLATGCTVISIDYRLAPEHPFPAAHEDCLAAAGWIARNIKDVGPSNGRLVLAGDSAGGNLAACTALQWDQLGQEPLAGALILYPNADHYSVVYPSYVERATGQGLTRELMQWFWDSYLGDTTPGDVTLARALPIRASNLAAMAPCRLITAERDPLRDEGAAFAKHCEAAGVAISYQHYADAEHGFACSEGRTEDFENFARRVGDWIGTLH